MEKPDHQLFHCRCLILMIGGDCKGWSLRSILYKYDRMDATRKHPIFNVEYGYCINASSRSEHSFRVN